MTTIKEIAAHLKITPTAVSYALNGRTGKVSAATQQRVLETARRMGYQPHAAARALRTGRHYAVLTLIRTPQSPYYAEIMHYLVQQVLAHPYQIIIQRAARPEDESKSLALDPTNISALHTGVDGYFIVDAPQTAAALRKSQAARTHPKPVISLGVFYDEGGDFVGVDLSQGTREAVLHLLQRGCRRIAYLIDAGTYSLNESRRAAYVSALEDAGFLPEFLVVPEQSRAAVYRFTRDYIAAEGCPDGMLCVNDEMAMGAHRSLLDLGRRIPEDVALVGCDGIPEARYARPSLATIVQPIGEMCQLAWGLLERRLEQPMLAPQQTLLVAKLSVQAFACGSPSDGDTTELPFFTEIPFSGESPLPTTNH